MATNRQVVIEFYKLWRKLAWLLISSPEEPFSRGCGLKYNRPPTTACQRLGWEVLKSIIIASARHRPPPRTYQVKGAGCTFVNGLYMYAGPLTPDGYAILEGPSFDADKRGNCDTKTLSCVITVPLVASAVMYRKIAEVDDDDEVSKTLTLHQPSRYNSQCYQWYLSATDERVSPYRSFYIERGAGRLSRYIFDLHVHPHLYSNLPNINGWQTDLFIDHEDSMQPSPILVMDGAMVPPGEESKTLEHQLAVWMVENNVLTIALRLARRDDLYCDLHMAIQFASVMYDLDTTANLGRQLIVDLARGICPEAGRQVQQPLHLPAVSGKGKRMNQDPMLTDSE